MKEIIWMFAVFALIYGWRTAQALVMRRHVQIQPPQAREGRLLDGTQLFARATGSHPKIDS